MLCALEKAEVDALKLDGPARQALEELDEWNEEEARRLVDRMCESGDNAIHNKNGYVITSVRRINESSGEAEATKGGHGEAEGVAALAEAGEEYSDEKEHYEEEDEEEEHEPYTGEEEWYDEGEEQYSEEY